MMHWLIQSTADLPDDQSFLNDQEQEKLATLATEKRRQDWLLGRWTAKLLVQHWLAIEQTAVSLNQIGIDNHPSGEPFLKLPAPLATRYAVTLSISHAHGHACCFVWPGESWWAGVDLEWIQPRSDSFVADYLTDGEKRCVADWLGARRDTDTAVTAIWSAKEAVLKALHLGLTVDTRSVSCHLPLFNYPVEEWHPFTIALDGQRLGPALPTLSGWWRVWGGFVITVAAGSKQ